MDALPRGSRFPELEFPTLTDGMLRVPTHLEGRPSVLLLYRGHF